MDEHMSKEKLLENIQLEHQRLEGTLADINEDQMITPGVIEDWTIKDILAHITVWEQRMVKTPWEVETIREGCCRACETVRSAFQAIRPGVNEREVHRVFWHAALENGLWDTPNVGTWLCFSSNAREAGGVHRWITQPVDRIIDWGDQGLCDCGPTFQGYQLDFQRNFYVGDPPEKFHEFYKIERPVTLEGTL